MKPNTPNTESGSKIFAKLQGLSIVGNYVSVDPQQSPLGSSGTPVSSLGSQGTSDARFQEQSAALAKEVATLRNRTDKIEERFTTTTPSLVGPKGKDGENGRDGRDGRDGKDGEQGPPGQKGVDGIPNASRKVITICTADGPEEIEVYVPDDSLV